jgi:hypothetical protein
MTSTRAAAHNYIPEEPTMAVKAMRLVGLDVHARQTHAVVLDPRSGEIGVSRLRVAPEEVVSFLGQLVPVMAVYEAGPTGFGLARRAP